MITVLASDSPHGVVMWDRLDHMIDEPTGSASARVTLAMKRSQGTMGDIRVTYM